MRDLWQLPRRVLLFVTILLYSVVQVLWAAEVPSERDLAKQVHYFEPLTHVTILRAPVAKPQAATSEVTGQSATEGRTLEVSFRAFNREFLLDLEPNDLLTPDAAILWVGEQSTRRDTLPSTLYKGHVRGESGSWVRVTLHNGVMTGMIRSQDAVYAIEPAERFASMTTSERMVMYRMADTASVWESGTCALEDPTVAFAMGSAVHPTTELQDFEALTAHLQAMAAGELKQLDMGIVADYEFFLTHGAQAANELLSILNQVDGIYQSELGVTLQVAQLVIFTTANDPFSNTTSPSLLLQELSAYKSMPSSVVYGTGLAHLFTGRNLSGSVIGVAWIGVLCEDFFGAGLSQYFTTNQAALVILAAHEIGHNFRAPHDNQAGSPCQSTPFGFLMNPFLSSSLRQEFSTCSKQQMAPEIASAACLTTAEPPPPPAVPTPIAPRGTIRDTTPTLEWSGVAEAKRYTLVLRDTTTQTKVFRLNLSARAGTRYTLTTPLDPTHKYVWRVRARVNDEWGAFSDWLWFRFASGVQ